MTATDQVFLELGRVEPAESASPQRNLWGDLPIGIVRKFHTIRNFFQRMRSRRTNVYVCIISVSTVACFTRAAQYMARTNN